jgi:amino acid transporter
MARDAWGIGWILVFLAIVNSAIANSNAGANASTRTWFAMARIRLLPASLGRVHPVYRSPHVAIMAQFGLGVILPLWLGFQYDPITAFSLLATVAVIVVVLIYIAVNIACMLFYLRVRRDEFNPLMHMVVPLVGIAVFIPAWLTAAGIPVFAFVGELTAPLSYAGPIVGGWMLIGVAYLAYLYAREPGRVKETGRIFVGEEALEQQSVG